MVTGAGTDLRGIRKGVLKGGGVKFRVFVSVNGTDQYVGSFNTQEEAVRARDERRLERRATGTVPTRTKRPDNQNAVETNGANGVCYDAVRNIHGQTVYGGRHATKEAAQAAAAALNAPTLPPELAALPLCPAPGITVRFSRKRGSPRSAPLVARYVARVMAGKRMKHDYHVGTYDTLEEAQAELAKARLGGPSRLAAITKMNGGEAGGEVGEGDDGGL